MHVKICQASVFSIRYIICIQNVYIYIYIYTYIYMSISVCISLSLLHLSHIIVVTVIVITIYNNSNILLSVCACVCVTQLARRWSIAKPRENDHQRGTPMKSHYTTPPSISITSSWFLGIFTLTAIFSDHIIYNGETSLRPRHSRVTATMQNTSYHRIPMLSVRLVGNRCVWTSAKACEGSRQAVFVGIKHGGNPIKHGGFTGKSCLNGGFHWTIYLWAVVHCQVWLHESHNVTTNVVASS